MLLLLALISLAAGQNLTGSPLNPVINIVSECGEDSAVLVLQEGKAIPGEGKAYPATSLDQCSLFCRQNQDASGPMACAGFNYANGECMIFEDYDPAALEEQEGSSVYQKACITSNRICASPFSFEMSPQKILVGFARHVEGNIKSIQECMQVCLNSVDEKDFECESVMYYPADEECILNTEDRRDRPELLAQEDTDLVIYLDNNCAGSQCYAPAVTQYIRIGNMTLESEPDISVPDQTLESCAYICDKRLSDTVSEFGCYAPAVIQYIRIGNMTLESEPDISVPDQTLESCAYICDKRLSDTVSEFGCYAPAVIQYIRIGNMTLESEPDISVPDQTLESCAYICDKRLSDTVSEFGCYAPAVIQYIRIGNMTLESEPDISVPDQTLESCAYICDKRLSDTVSKFGCYAPAVIQYIRIGNMTLESEPDISVPDQILESCAYICDKRLSDTVSEFGCYAPAVTQYIRIGNMTLESEPDISVPDQTLESCAYICDKRLSDTVSEFGCYAPAVIQYIRIGNMTLESEPDISVPDQTLESCAYICDKRLSDTVSEFGCYAPAVIQYIRIGNMTLESEPDISVPDQTLESCAYICDKRLSDTVSEFGCYAPAVIQYIRIGNMTLESEPDISVPDQTVESCAYICDKRLSDTVSEFGCYAPAVTQYIRIGNMTLESEPDISVPDQTLESCAYICDKRLSDTVSEFGCYAPAVIQYIRIGNMTLESEPDISVPDQTLESCAYICDKRLSDTVSEFGCYAPAVIQYIRIGNMTLESEPDISVPDQTLESCAYICDKRLSDTVSEFGCYAPAVIQYIRIGNMTLESEPDISVPDQTLESCAYICDKRLSDTVSEFGCYAPAVTQYIRIGNMTLESEPDISVPDQTLESCAYICDKRLSDTATDFSCKSFSYDPRTRDCHLNDERSLPLGRDRLVSAPGVMYHEKKCFESPRTCRNVGAYERVPQMILVGFAAFVLENINSVTKCLDACISPPPETGEAFKCASVMYYYNEQECILNTESRSTQPDLFIPEGEGFLVDYFDIACSRDEEPCPAGTSPTAIRTSDRLIAPANDATQIAQTSGSPADCAAACYSVSPEKCRSFNYADGVCTHLIISSDTGVLENKNGQAAYELQCLIGAEEACGGSHEASFDRQERKQRGGRPSAGKTTIGSLNYCLSECLQSNCAGLNYNIKSGACEWFGAGDGANSLSSDDMWDYYENLCANAKLPVQKKPIREPAVPAPTQPPIPAGPPGVRTLCDFSGMKVIVTQEQPFTGAFFVKNKYQGCKVEVKNSRTAMLDLGFPTGLQQIGGPLPPGVAPNTQGFFPQVRRVKRQEEGVVPAPTVEKHQNILNPGPSIIRSPTIERFLSAAHAPDAPLTAIRDAQAAGVAPPPSIALKDCGVSDLNNGTYSATVVVQTNNFGIPGLVTSMDQIYTVSCDYSNMMGDGAKAQAKLAIDGPVVTDIRPQGKIELSSPVMMQMLSAGGPEEEQTPMIRAEIGDMLELRWNMMAFDDSLDFFVRECTAEKGGPIAPGQQTSLKILERGCPTAAVAGKLVPDGVKKVDKHTKTLQLQAFRFDGSRTVRVICQLDICSGDCVPADCDIDGKTVLSNGRKKRAVPEVGGKIETGRYIVSKEAEAMASLVIVDTLAEAELEAELESFRARAPTLSAETLSESVFEEAMSMEGLRGAVCLPKASFLGVFLFLGGLCLAQAAFVGVYAAKRYHS